MEKPLCSHTVRYWAERWITPADIEGETELARFNIPFIYSNDTIIR